MSTIDAALLLVLGASAPIITWIAAVLVRAAWQRPRIQFLTSTALLTLPIAAVVDVVVLSAINGLAGQPVGSDTVRIVFRLILLVLVAAVFRWWWIYRTGGFRD